ncbi:molecular chaperone [Pseudomonas gessardii]|uniref:fimbrial biogenesis chaperone n=1 Tax=Pseudomonas gessardii TaxID=78544 RepID=UPI0018D7D9D7|nr:molecular chaperone [Pseudomonas gessardii]MBH3424159.1 molecular chaperone [Pseudomonas gessardii]
MPSVPLRLQVALCLCLAVGQVQAGVVISGTRQVYPQPRREITVQVTNDDRQAARLVQVWMDDGDTRLAAEHSDVPFSISPPVFRLDPGKSQAIRLAYTQQPLPADKESLFWLNVLEVPPEGQKPGVAAAEDSQNRLRFAFRIRTKVFFRPHGLAGNPQDAPGQLTWTLRTGKQAVLRVFNPSPFHVTFHEVALAMGPQAEAARILTDQQGMVAPYASLDLALPPLMQTVPEDAQVQFQYIDDFGGFSAPQRAPL